MKYFLAFAVFTQCVAFGQSQLGAGSMSGSILDPSGNSVAEAAVQVTGDETGLVRRVTTSNAGTFSIPVLPLGHYSLKVEKAGFSTLEQKAIEVSVGSSVTLSLTLTVGAVATQIEVTSVAPAIDTTRTSEVALIDRMEINDLPINGRRYDQFALLAPGVTRDARFGLLSYHGTSGIYNNFTIEGNDDNQALFSEARGRTRIASSISANAIEEFQVPTTNFMPEYGRTVGGGVNSVVRSGGNIFHFDAFFYFRDWAMGALDPVAKASGAVQTYEQREQFGGSIGGAILANRLFYFLNYDQQIRPFPLLTSDTGKVLTTGLPTNPTAAQLAAFNTGVAFLTAKFPDGAPNNTVPRTNNQQTPLAKLDWLVNPKNTASATFNFMRWYNPDAIQTPAVLGNVGRNGFDGVRIYSLNLRLTTSLSPTMVNEARFQTGRDFEYEFSDQTGPQVTVGGFSYGTATFLPRAAYPDERRLQFTDNFSITRGTHNFKFGGEINRARDILNNPANFAGAYTYSNALTLGQDLINPASHSYSNYVQAFGLPGLDFATIDWSWYAQDQWKIARGLMLNYGLRWDYEQTPQPPFPNPAIPETTHIHQNAANFGPRVGTAWDIFKNGKTVVRGGYGLVYGRITNGVLFNALTQNGLTDPTRSTITLTTQPTDSFAPNFPNIYPALPAAAAGSVSAFRLASDFQNPRSQEVNIGVTQQLQPNLTLSVSYVYTYGDHLPAVIDSNLPMPTFSRTYQLPDGSTFTVPFAAGIIKTAAGVTQNLNLSRPNPNFGALSVNTSIGQSWYKAMFVELKRRFAGGLTGGISYTLAKADNTSGNGDGGGTGPESPFGGASFQNQFDLAKDRAPSPLDQRHRAVVYAVWQLPFGKNTTGVLHGFAGGWGISSIFSAETGRPYSPNISVNSVQFLGTDGAVYNGFGGLLGLGGTGNFVPTLGRDSIYSDNNYKIDLRISKIFRVAEHLSIEALGEGFNITNHANYNGNNSTLYATTATTATTPLSAPITLTQQSNFGIPNNDGSQPDGTNARRLQIALRLKF
jgi:Carboxypeptidase regulatory-like domain